MRNETPINDDLIREAEESRHPFEPEVTLFVSDSPESKLAVALLETNEEPYRTIISNDARVPVAVFGYSAYEKLTGIQELVAELHSFDADAEFAYQKHVQVRHPVAGAEGYVTHVVPSHGARVPRHKPR